jgi:SAM-dependent methyltransferase
MQQIWQLATLILGKLIALPALVFHRNVFGYERLMPVYQPFVKWKKAHFERYAFASRLLKPTDAVLDLACGVGYGTALLATHCRTATGVDISQSAIRYARKRYKRSNNIFMQGDLFEYPDSPRFEVVVSFETAEHLDRPLEDTVGCLCSRATRLFVGSVPYREKPGNVYHHKFNLAESDFDFLRRHGRTRFYYQEREPGYRIYEDPKQTENPQILIFVVDVANTADA